MPITFDVGHDGLFWTFSTDQCGTCGEFWHSSLRSGGCRQEYKKGSISVCEKRCEHWKLKDKYRSAVKHEISEVEL